MAVKRFVGAHPYIFSDSGIKYVAMHGAIRALLAISPASLKAASFYS